MKFGPIQNQEGAKPYSAFDHILIRVKDVILIGASLVAGIAWFGGFLSIPKRVEANEVISKTIQEKQVSQDLKIQALEKDIGYIVRAVGEIKANQKAVYEEIMRSERLQRSVRKASQSTDRGYASDFGSE